MLKIVEMSHLIISEYLKHQTNHFINVCDATCGKGGDTLFVSKILKNNGHIDSFDIQQVALEETNLLLKENNVQNVNLINDSFININPHIYDLVIFNLGYLPGGSKEITTKKDDTINILNKLIEEIKIKDNLLVVMSIYPGHEEGKKESIAVDEIIKNLDSSTYMVSKYQNYNRPSSPYLVTISKTKIHCK